MPAFIESVLVVLLGAIVFEAVRILELLTISRKLTHSIKPFERIRPSAGLRILLVGDSTGYGTGTTDSKHSIAGRLGADFPDAHIENWSKTGLKLQYINRRLARAAPQQPFTLVIIMAGGMNVVYRTPLARLARLIAEVIGNARRLGTNVIVVAPNNAGLAPMFRFPLSRLHAERGKRAERIFLEECRKQGVRCVSLYCEGRDLLSAPGLRSPDQTHPTDEGYGLWYNEIRGAVFDALKLPASVHPTHTES